MMKKRRLKIIICTFIIIFFSGFLLYTAFAKYRKSVNQNIGINLATWNIKLNNESIAGKESISTVITPIFEKNEYIAENVLAPGVTGYFDIEIDASEVDVSFSYAFTTKVKDYELYPDIIAYGYIIDPDNQTEIIEYDENTGITGTIIHNTETTKVRMFIKWDDDEENQMDNTADTALAINNSTLTMIATFKFEQLKND